ncbi:MAG: manganese-dependent inorganic pyrophosphatase [Rhodobacteraceae bacterium]|nr:manganese-dependent inorganic pyrophosphatase [Paracoccaceae bacterium]
MIKIFGHKSPDTDSTGSPIIWAWYLSTICGLPAEAKLLGDPNTEATFVLDYWKVNKPGIIEEVSPNDKIVIVDTNNPSELPQSVINADIIEIIDHHLLVGGLKTKSPPKVTIRPLACTATVMYDLMGKDTDKMPNSIKGLMLSCILSDTLEFRSPTTTEYDKEVALSLAKDLDIDLSVLATKMFEAKSDVSKISDENLIKMDSKQFEISGKELRISVLETTSPNTVLKRKKSLINAMPKIIKDEGLDEILLFIVDILNQESTLLIPNENIREIAKKSFNVKSSEDFIKLPGVVSRKKQIIPNIKI